MTDTVIKIPPELFATAESSRFEGTIEVPELSVGPDTYHFPSPLAWSVDVTDTGGAFLVAGTVEGNAEVTCARCLGPASYDFLGDIEGYFLMEGAEAEDTDEDEDAPGADEFDVLPADHRIDLEPLILAALMVDAPQQPLCQDDCKGLCPQCGADLNEGECGCPIDGSDGATEKGDHPFAALADFPFTDN